MPPDQSKKQKPKPAQMAVPQPPEPKQRENERKIPRRYLLTKLRDGGFYTPMTDPEFEEFKRLNPQIAQYFEVGEDGEEDIAPISGLEMPDVPDSAPIFDQWEKAAQRLLTMLQKDQKAYLFANPVDY